ncbi:MAG TPA: DUF1569 domain-containing protein [Terriglobales bacterium]
MDAILTELRNVLASAIEGMSKEELIRHPEGKWSSAEILDHLNLTYLGTIKNFERCLASGQSGASTDRHSKRWQRRLVTDLGYFPKGRKSPERVLPRGTPVHQLTTEIFENIARMDDVIEACAERFSRTKPIAEHPIIGPLTAKEWRKFHLVHGKHHARQILKLKNSAPTR